MIVTHGFLKRNICMLGLLRGRFFGRGKTDIWGRFAKVSHKDIQCLFCIFFLFKRSIVKYFLRLQAFDFFDARSVL